MSAASVHKLARTAPASSVGGSTAESTAAATPRRPLTTDLPTEHRPETAPVSARDHLAATRGGRTYTERGRHRATPERPARTPVLPAGTTARRTVERWLGIPGIRRSPGYAV